MSDISPVKAYSNHRHIRAHSGGSIVITERLADLDELLLRCRAEQSRAFIREAVGCYRADAFRACIVVTYIVVLYDLIAKLRKSL